MSERHHSTPHSVQVKDGSVSVAGRLTGRLVTCPTFSFQCSPVFLFPLPSSPCPMSLPSPLPHSTMPSLHSSGLSWVFAVDFLSSVYRSSPFSSIFIVSLSICLLFLLLSRSTEAPGKVLRAFCTRWAKFGLGQSIHTDTTPPTRGLRILYLAPCQKAIYFPVQPKVIIKCNPSRPVAKNLL